LERKRKFSLETADPRDHSRESKRKRKEGGGEDLEGKKAFLINKAEGVAILPCGVRHCYTSQKDRNVRLPWGFSPEYFARREEKERNRELSQVGGGGNGKWGRIGKGAVKRTRKR